MNQRIAKKIRQVNRRNWRAYLKAIRDLSFRVQLGLAWWLVFGDKRKV